MITPRNIKIDGIIPIIPTIFDQKERIDWSAFDPLLDFACGIDVCAVCLPAYASEFYKLSDAERREVIAKAVEQTGSRMPVIAQANAGSARHTVELARFAQEAGATAVSVAAPRMFAIDEKDLMRHFDRILSAIEVPLVLQDFNPGGPTVSTSFITQLHRQHPHFRWVKLEEPLMAARIASILDATSGEVGVLEGWGGMYLLELVAAGICGVMPSLSLADLLARIFRLAKRGHQQEAYEVFTGTLPQIVFSLQNMEIYHHAEKRLLAARGIINEISVREPRLGLSPLDAAHIDFLNANILALLDRLKMPRFPRSVKAAEISEQHTGTKVHCPITAHRAGSS
ncbi:MAG TPA: dihydrodipicolinate synthase family protein [Terriglobia bacterium]|nr:dihydrodipicolinate synthase family protein [Terriglobia bacterium]